MKLSTLFSKSLLNQKAILVGEPEETIYMDSENKPYLRFALKNPITVRCSVDTDIEAFPTDEVFVRASALDLEWTPVNPENLEEGFYMEGWLVDFSKGQGLPLYQETTIKKWSQENRKGRNSERNEALKGGRM